MLRFCIVGKLFVRIFIRKVYIWELCSREFNILNIKDYFVSVLFWKNFREVQDKSSCIVIVDLIKERILSGIRWLFQRKWVGILKGEKESSRIGLEVPRLASKSAWLWREFVECDLILVSVKVRFLVFLSEFMICSISQFLFWIGLVEGVFDKFLIAILLSKKIVRVEFVGIVSRSVMIENSSIRVESGYGEDAALNLIDISLLQI